MDSNNLQTPISEGTVHLWIANLKSWSDHAERLKSILSKEELKRLDRLKVKDKREEFLLSRGILRIILSKYIAQDPRNLDLDTSPTGKPFLPKARIQFNLSHSGDFFACGICTNNQIGLDIQENYPISSLDRIIKNFFSSSEIQYLSTLPSGDEYQDHFFAIWTAKEAYLKAVGDGIRGSFNQISILPESPNLQSFQLEMPESKNEGLAWTITSLNISQGFHAALAYDGDLKGLERFEFLPENFFIP